MTQQNKTKLTAMLLATGLITSLGAPVFAATGDLVCEVKIRIDFSSPYPNDPAYADYGLLPGTTVDTNNIAIIAPHAPLLSCVSLNGHYSHLKSGYASGPGTATAAAGANPCSLQLTTSGSHSQMVWNSTVPPMTRYSYFDFMTSTNALAGTVQSSSQVTSGELAGDVVTNAPLSATVNLDCLSKGLKWLELPITFNSWN